MSTSPDAATADAAAAPTHHTPALAHRIGVATAKAGIAGLGLRGRSEAHEGDGSGQVSMDMGVGPAAAGPDPAAVHRTSRSASLASVSASTNSDSPLPSATPSAPLPPLQPPSGPSLQFVAPSSYLRPIRSGAAQHADLAGPGGVGFGAGRSRPGSAGGRARPMTPTDREQVEGLRAIRAFLKVRTSYDVLPLSYRLIVFDTSLLVKKSLSILIQNGIVSAPLWDSKTSTFAGLLTTSDYINLVQYYWQNPDALAQIDQFKLNSLREIERALGVTPIETVSCHPMEPLYEACRRMLQSRARRIPLVDIDDETHREMVVSVITQYRILKFVSVNVKETQMLRKPLRDIPQLGTYRDLSTATMDTPVMDVIQMLVKRSISSVPILDPAGDVLLNVFEAVDVITLIKGGDYENLNLSVGKALEKRPDDFPGIYTCTLNDRLDTIFDTIRKSRVHRLVVIDEANRLKGLLSLSDILNFTLNSALPEDSNKGDDEDR